MRLIDKYNCILCKYNKYNKGNDSCFNHQEKDEYGYPVGECKSLSNIYYGTLIKFFPFKQIDNLLTERAWRKEEKYNNKMDEKYVFIDELEDYEQSTQDKIIRATRKSNLTKQTLLDTFTEKGLIGVYNLGLKNMLDYLNGNWILDLLAKEGGANEFYW